MTHSWALRFTPKSVCDYIFDSYACDTFGGPESCDNHHSRAVTHYGASLIIKINYRGCDTFRVLCDTYEVLSQRNEMVGGKVDVEGGRLEFG